MKYKKVLILWLLTLGGCNTLSKQHQNPYHPVLTHYIPVYSAVQHTYSSHCLDATLCYRHACDPVIRFPADYPASVADYRYSFVPPDAYTHSSCCMVNQNEVDDSVCSAISAYPPSAVCPVVIQASVTSCAPFCFIGWFGCFCYP
ncbi:hypothetical protein [Cardinium endosymbiont of Sogatella furcifera]|uniref:hypothetical protein n=1 Tax=Cardinium endosymbiont of Sogatella furcifera TaxID=650378 RepID=UPI0013B3D708|nr:hypothetical protein [Cardinium endosymbiont of Sogatella furcifera]